MDICDRFVCDTGHLSLHHLLRQFEFGRKIRAPADERVGVETYSALWGPLNAAAVWWIALAISALLAVVTAAAVGDRLPVIALAAVATAVAAALAARFASAPSTRTSRWIQAWSGLWLVAAYVAIGVVALPGAMR
jgi:4-hydroxybenzoate polyprenyltransferase